MNPKLLIITDLGRLKAYRLTTTPQGSPHLEHLETVVLDEAHHRLVEQVSDLAGRHATPTQKNWGAPLADDHNLKLETKRRLIRKIAIQIEELALKHPDCSLWLAAHREINHLITSALAKAVRERIQTNLARDLVKADEKELIESFAPEMLAQKSAPSPAPNAQRP